MINDKWLGFTLVEVLVTLAIIALMGTVAGAVYYKGYHDEVAYQDTIEVLDTIKKAILGSNIPHNRGVHISGYVADMGALPRLNKDRQPEALWNKTRGLKSSKYYEEERIRTGWNGPYIREPDGGFLKDGWGNGLSFRCDKDGTLTIKSYGADMKQGGTELDKDIILRIKKYHYMAPIGFRFAGLKDDLRKFEINYPDPKDGSIHSEELELGDSVLFVSDGDDRPLFPIGLRSITADIWHRGDHQEKVIVFPIQPGMNYMGTIE